MVGLCLVTALQMCCIIKAGMSGEPPSQDIFSHFCDYGCELEGQN